MANSRKGSGRNNRDGNAALDLGHDKTLAAHPAPEAPQDAVAALFGDSASKAGVGRDSAGADPVSSLFSSDAAVPAPDIGDLPNENELSRWEVTSKSGSLFDDRVPDAAGAAPIAGSPKPAPAPAGARKPPAPAAGGGRRETALGLGVAPPPAAAAGPRDPNAVIDLAPPRAAVQAAVEQQPAPPPPSGRPGTGVVIEPPPPLANEPPPVKKRGVRADRPGAKSGRRRRRPEKPEAAPPPKPAAARRRGASRRTKYIALSGLGVVALGLVATLLVMLDLVPTPFSEPSAAAGRLPAPQAAAAPAKPPPPKAAVAAKVPDQRAEPTSGKTSGQPSQQAQARAQPERPRAKADDGAQAKTADATRGRQQAQPGEQAREPASASAGAEAAQGDDDEVSEDERDVRRLMYAARRKLSLDEPEAAEALMRRALAIDPRDHHAMEVMAHALMAQDRAKEAVSYARKMVERRKRRVSYRLLLGDALLMAGDASGAKTEWRIALKIEPNNKEIKRRLSM